MNGVGMTVAVIQRGLKTWGLGFDMTLFGNNHLDAFPPFVNGTAVYTSLAYPNISTLQPGRVLRVSWRHSGSPCCLEAEARRLQNRVLVLCPILDSFPGCAFNILEVPLILTSSAQHPNLCCEEQATN